MSSPTYRYEATDGQSRESALHAARNSALQSEFLRQAAQRPAPDGQPMHNGVQQHHQGPMMASLSQQFMPTYAPSMAQAQAQAMQLHGQGAGDPRMYQMMQQRAAEHSQYRPPMTPQVPMAHQPQKVDSAVTSGEQAGVPQSLLARERWTREEDAVLLRSRASGLSWRAIAERIGSRTVSACRSRHYSLTSERTDDATLMAARQGSELNAALAAGELDPNAVVDSETLQRTRVRPEPLVDPTLSAHQDDGSSATFRSDPAETDFHTMLIDATLESLKGVLMSDAFRRHKLDETDEIVSAAAQLSAAVASVVCSALLKHATDRAPPQGAGTKRSADDAHLGTES